MFGGVAMHRRKIKFALELRDGEQVRSMEELREHFDTEKIIGYFQDGKLVEWLDDRFYTDEAEEVRKLSKDDLQLGKKLCNILRVGYTEADDVETIAWRKERLDRLKQYTADPKIIEEVDMVAFEQDDLEDIIREKDVETIYLCDNTFTFPSGILKKRNICYVGIGKNVEVNIESKGQLNLDDMGIIFENIQVKRLPKEDDGIVEDAVGHNMFIKHYKERCEYEESHYFKWYQRTDFLSEYIYKLLTSSAVPDTRYHRMDGEKKFIYIHKETQLSCPAFTRAGLLNEEKEIILCTIKDLRATIAFTNVALYAFHADIVRILYSDIDIVQEDKNTHRLDIFYSNGVYSRIFCETLGNPIAIKMFLKVAAGIKPATVSERVIVNNPEIRLASLGGKTVGERMY